MAKRKKKLHHDWHHRKPRSLGGKNTDDNMSHVSARKHQAWHTMFKNYDAKQIAKIINDIWLDPDYRFVVVRNSIMRKGGLIDTLREVKEVT